MSFEYLCGALEDAEGSSLGFGILILIKPEIIDKLMLQILAL